MNSRAYVPRPMRPSEPSLFLGTPMLDRLRRAIRRFGYRRLAFRLAIPEAKLRRIWELRVVYRSTYELLDARLPQ